MHTVVEDVTMMIPFPKQVRMISYKVLTGSVVYYKAGNIAKWTLGNWRMMPA
jgi:hypothetical protein